MNWKLVKSIEMNVLFLVHSYSDVEHGGESRIPWDLSLALSRRAVNIFVMTAYKSISSGTKLPPNIKVYQVPFGKHFPSWDQGNMFLIFLFSLPLFLIKKIDVIHVASTLEATPFNLFKVRPLIQSAHPLWPYNDPQFQEDLAFDRKHKLAESGVPSLSLKDKIINKIAAVFFRVFGVRERLDPRTDLYIVREKAFYRELTEKGFKTVYISNGVDFARFAGEPKIKRSDQSFTPLEVARPIGPSGAQARARLLTGFTFLYIGKLCKRKGVHHLIPAFQKLSREYPDAKLICAGDSSPEGFRLFRAMADDNPQIIFQSGLSNDDVIELYKQGDAFVLPILCGPFNLVVLEAMASGLPVIVSRCSGSADPVIDGKTGLLTEVADVEDIYQKMKYLYEHREETKQMGRNAREEAKKYSWDEVAEETMRAYEGVLGK